MSGDYQILNGHAVPISELATAIHSRLLVAVAKSSGALLLDGTRPVGKVRMGTLFDGPDADGWYSGKVSIDPETLDYTFPAPTAGPMAIFSAATLDAPISVAIDQWGGLVFRADSLGLGDPEGRCSSDLPDFHVRCFSPILRSQAEAR